jgi:hypothetical protein
LPWIIALDHCPGSLPWIIALDHCPGSLPWIIALDHCPGSLPWTVTLDYRPAIHASPNLLHNRYYATIGLRTTKNPQMKT